VGLGAGSKIILSSFPNLGQAQKVSRSCRAGTGICRAPDDHGAVVSGDAVGDSISSMSRLNNSALHATRSMFV